MVAEPVVLDLPGLERVVEHGLEALRLAREPAGLALQGEPHRAEGGAREAGDLTRRPHPQADAPSRARGSRTHLPLRAELLRVLQRQPPGRVGLTGEQGLADGLLEPTHGHPLRPLHPGREVAVVGLTGDHQPRDGLGLHPGEGSVAVGGAQLRAEFSGSLETQQRPRLAGRHAETIARVGGERLVAVAPLVLGGGHDAEQGGHLGLEPLLEPHGLAQAGVELVGVGVGDSLQQGTQEARQLGRWRRDTLAWGIGRDRMGCAHICHLGRLRFVYRRNLDRFVPQRASSGRRRFVLEPCRQPREHLPGHPLEHPPGRRRLARDLRRVATGAVPLEGEADRHAQRQHRGGLLVDAGIGHSGANRPELPAVDRSQLALEAAHAHRLGPGDEVTLVVGADEAREQADLAPGQPPRDERRLEPGKAGQPGADPRQLLHRARGDAQSLARIVAEPRVAERLEAAALDELPGQRRQHPAQGPARPRQLGELRLGGLVGRLTMSIQRRVHGATSAKEARPEVCQERSRE